MIVVTAASGQLGRLVIEELLKTTPASEIIAAVRTPEKVSDLAAKGIQVRQADYSKPVTLESAFQGADTLLLISSSEVGQRFPQHKNVIEAAKKAGISWLIYTSVLRADTSQLNLAKEHLQTEQLLQSSGIPSTILRNGWYTENYLASLPVALEHGAFLGSAADGKISSAARADYALAAANILKSTGHKGKTYELAGDDSYTLSDLAAVTSKLSGKQITYKNMPEADYKATLIQFGLPEPFAEIYAQSDAAASNGALFNDGHQLSKLIGRKTTTLEESVKQALV